MTAQDIRETNFLIYRWDVNPQLPEAKQLQDCERCGGWGFTDADKARSRDFGHCAPCFGTGYEYPGDNVVNQALAV